MYCGDEVAAIVGDVGYSNARFGFAGEDMPKALLPGQVGYSQESKWAVGDAALAGAATKPGVLVRQAVRGVDSLVEDWDALEQLWAKGLSWCRAAPDPHAAKKRRLEETKAQGAEVPAAGETVGAGAADDDDASSGAVAGGHGILCGESAMASSAERRKLMELFFERFDAPSLYLAPAPMLAAFAAGRSTALVVDCGGGGCSVTPVLDGFVLRQPAKRTPRGGEWITDQVLALVEARLGRSAVPRFAARTARLSARGSKPPQAADTPTSTTPPWSSGLDATAARFLQREVGRSVKEDLCGFPFFRMEDDGLAHHLPIAGRPSEVELPDGTSVHLDPQLFRVPERLFDVDDANSNNNNNLHGTVQHGKNGAHVALHKLVHASLDACDVDLRRDLANTVLLTGAGSQFKYFPERLQREVASLLPPAFKAKVVCPAPVERRFGAWLGGSVLASLGSFQQLWLSRAQYEELGPDRAEARFAEV